MSSQITLSPVLEKDRALLDTMAARYFAEALPEGPPFYPAALDRYWRSRRQRKDRAEGGGG